MDVKTGFFYVFSLVLLFAAFRVITARNPVHAVLYLMLSFSQASAIWLLLKAEFLAITLVLVYLGAVMVLFLFIIMLLDLKDEEKRANSLAPIAAGLGLSVAFVVQLVGILSRSPNKVAPALDQATLSSAAKGFPESGKIALALNQGKLPDVHLIGHTLFTQYNLPLQVLGVLLLVATVGVVVLSKKQAD